MNGQRILGNGTFAVRFHKPVGNVEPAYNKNVRYRDLYFITQKIVDTIIDHELVGFYAAQCELQTNIDAFERNMDEIERIEHLSERKIVPDWWVDRDRERFVSDNAKIIGRMQEFYEALAKFTQLETSRQMNLETATRELKDCFEASEAYQKEILTWPVRWRLLKETGVIMAPDAPRLDSWYTMRKTFFPFWYFEIYRTVWRGDWSHELYKDRHVVDVAKEAVRIEELGCDDT